MARTRMMMVGAALGLVLAACGGAAEEPGTPEGEAGSTPADTAEADSDGDVAAADADTPTGEDGQGAAGPVPDPDRLEDPCAAHEGREMDSFIDVVAPVDEQVVSEEMELVGCANVFEATVVWNLLDGDGRLLDEGFTTATCGSGCVGAFAEVVSLEAAADEPVAYLQVFSPNMADEGPEQLELVEVMVVIE